MKRPTNQQIVGGFNRSEKWAIEWIYEEYRADVYEQAYGQLKNNAEAEDLTADTFEKLLHVKDRQGSIGEIRDLLYIYAKNLAADRSKKQKVERNYIARLSEELPVFSEAEMYRSETAAALYHEIYKLKNKLTPQCQRVFELYYLEQKTIGEIAREMNISEKTVFNNKSKAMRVMRLHIEPRRPFIFLLTLFL